MWNRFEIDPEGRQGGNQMPTKRTPIGRGMVPQISPAILSHLSESLWPMPEDGDSEVENWKWMNEEERKRIIGECKDFILTEWVKKKPGSRPAWWWLHYAPEKSRLRLGGIGDPEHEFLSTAEAYDYGIPRSFVQQWSVEYYNGRRRDIHGNLIENGHKDGDFKGRAIDPKDPPRYESEAAYLERHGLLIEAEKDRLAPEDFEPDVLEMEE